MSEILYAFDLDGTVTEQEILPCIAEKLGLAEELTLLTRLTLEGVIPFASSFRLRFHILRSIPLAEIQDTVGQIPLNPDIAAFIAQQRENCLIVTGNLDCWIRPLLEKLGCRALTSTSRNENGRLELQSVLDKGEAIRSLDRRNRTLVAIGESANDIPMFREADISIAFGGVHNPVPALAEMADYIVRDGKTLCGLLRALRRPPEKTLFSTDSLRRAQDNACHFGRHAKTSGKSAP